MAFTYCESCRRYFNERKSHDCPAAPAPEVAKRKPVKWTWRREWYAETAADRVIAKKFKNVKTAEIF